MGLALSLGRIQGQFSQNDSSRLPLVFLEVPGGGIVNEPKVPARMCIIEDEKTTWNHWGDDCEAYEGWIGIEIRGSSSQSFPKVGYGFETRKEDGSNRNVELLGLPKENDWIFYGPYSDKTLIRNALTYRLGRSLRKWAPRTRFVELFIEGEYQGVYVLMEKIKRDKNRVNIAEMSPTDNAGEELTGGYILKIDKFTGTDGYSWKGEFGDVFQVDYPKNEDLSSSQKTYIQQQVQQFEESLRQRNFNDPDLGYRQYIDLESFADFLFINELTKNVDGYRLSTYLYKDRDSRGDGKFHMGPLWDFNLALGNANYCTGSGIDGWVLNFNNKCPGDGWLISGWWDRMLTDTVFTQLVQSRWATLRQGPLRTEVVLGQIDQMVEELGPAAIRNHEHWGTLGTYVWSNSFVGDTYPEEIDFLKNWLQDRLAWMDENIANISSSVRGFYSFSQLHIYPNPFAKELIFNYQFSVRGNYRLAVHDLQGRPVYEVEFGGDPDVYHTFRWDGRDRKGNLLPPGTYLYTVWRNEEIDRVGKIQKY